MVNQPITPIDYTNLGYESMREAMLALAHESLPEWTDFSEQDLGVLLVELFAYACDITLYYQTRIANNLFPATSDEPDALVQLLRLIGYELRPTAPATANLQLTFSAPVTTPITIPANTKFFVPLSSGKQLTFETERLVQILPDQLTAPDANNFQYTAPETLSVPVVQGETIEDEVVAISDGQPNQMYVLQQPQVIAGSVKVAVTELGNLAYWREVASLADSGPTDRFFAVQRNAEGVATLAFGDGMNGFIPPRGVSSASPVMIKATYRVGGGPEGNVPAFTRFDPSPLPPPNPNIVAATNPQAAAGGASSEDINRARSLAPRLFRTQQRAVTLKDYVDLALQVPGVGKALAVPLNWNLVQLIIAPTGQVTDPSESLQRDLLAFFESYRMATTILDIRGPRAADIYLRATVRAQPYYRVTDVRTAVEQAVANYFAFDAVEFGQPIYLSKIYDVIQDLPQLVSLTVTKFSRNPDVMGNDVEASGIITLAPNELPRPGYRDNPLPAIAPTPIVLDIQGGVR